MGVNARVTLPSTVRAEDVMMVIGILAGHAVEKSPFSSGNGGWSAEFVGRKNPVKAHMFRGANTVPDIFDVTVDWLRPDGKLEVRSATYEFEHEEHTRSGNLINRGNRGLYPKSNPFWVAVSRKLVAFFGGSMIANDSDDSGRYSRSSPRWLGRDNDGALFCAKQEAFLKLKAITKDDLLKALEQGAAYGNPNELW